MTLRVDGVEIPESAIEYELQRLIKFHSEHVPGARLGKEDMKALRARAREQAIGNHLLMREAANKGLTVPQEEVDAALKQLIENAGGTDKFHHALRDQKMTEDMVRRSIRIGKQVDRLVSQITGSIPEPTEEEIRDFYDRNRNNCSTPERAYASHILIKPESASAKDMAAAKEQIHAIRKQFEGGVSFAELAATHSQCPSGKQAGGAIGWVNRGSMTESFDKALFSTPIGEMSDIIETPLGLHVAIKTRHEDARVAPLEEMKESIRDLLMHDRKGRAISRYVEQLKANALIVDDAP